ncbi:hypothetical protein [Fibrella aquatilis]|uniref:Nudix hydrolase domain-containing protein n=1 Tax=Fibrella aquatilis TaxID=2817059 RepID=A0A939K2X2_9BACT|nr:hypothetical protein [Fibrella aquatilis]MBO0933760.1 hypothetical protein [Fibrella aquatilis]
MEFVGGAIFGALIGVLFTSLFQKYVDNKVEWAGRFTRGKIRKLLPSKVEQPDKKFSIGDIVLEDCRLLDGIDSDYRVNIQHSDEYVHLPDDLQKLSQDIKHQNEERERKGERPIFQDLKPFGIKSLHFKRDEATGEHNVCIVRTLRSSFYNSLITKNLNTILPDGQTVKAKYYDQIIDNPYELSPNNFNLIHALGVNILIITKDNQAIISKRNAQNVASSSGMYSISVCEHLNEEIVDFDINRTIQAKKVAKHGILQELGITENEIIGDVKFFAVGFMPSLCHYEIIGMAYVSLDSNQIEASIRNIAKDGSYEISKVEFVEFTLPEVVNFFKTTNLILTEWLVATLIICLQQQFSYMSFREIAESFRGEFWKNSFKERVSKA